MPRRPKPPPKPERRSPGAGSIVWVEKRQRWRARRPKRPGEQAPRESWHPTRDEAEAWLARELARDPDGFDPSQTVGHYYNYWFRLQRSRWSEQTVERYLSEAAAIGPEITRTPLLRLRGDHVMARQAAMLEQGLSKVYVYCVISLLRRALADAVRWKILAENVAETVTLPSPEHRPAQAWDLAEVRAVLAAIRGHRFEAIYLLILWGGLRIGEVVALRWDDIADDGTVTFSRGEHTGITGRPIGATKRERERETQLPAHVVARLKELRAAGPAQPVFWSAGPTVVAFVYVAQRPDGERWHPHTIRTDWKRLVATVKLDDETVKPLRPHGGRRTYGTQHMVAGTALADVSSLLGHVNPSITARHYLGTSRVRRREAAERLAAMIEPPNGTVEGLGKGQSPS